MATRALIGTIETDADGTQVLTSTYTKQFKELEK